MLDKELAQITLEFAVDIITLVKELRKQKEGIISTKLGRCGAGIGATLRAADYTSSKKVLIEKLEIALEQTCETAYWLEVLFKTNYITVERFEELNVKCTTIRVMLLTASKTTKGVTKWVVKFTAYFFILTLYFFCYI